MEDKESFKVTLMKHLEDPKQRRILYELKNRLEKKERQDTKYKKGI